MSEQQHGRGCSPGARFAVVGNDGLNCPTVAPSSASLQTVMAQCSSWAVLLSSVKLLKQLK